MHINLSTMKQKDAFLNYEANNYFNRNKDVEYIAEHDIALKVLKEYQAHPKHVLEIGCSYGYRLDAISRIFQDAKTIGIEPSSEAIRRGRALFPGVNFIEGTADDLSPIETASCDIVIIGFVLYVVDREILFKVISEADRVLADGGILMIIDFFSEKPARNPYQHIQDTQGYAFKQNYDDVFVSSKLYHLLDKRSLNHISKGPDWSDDYHNKYAMTTLRKDLSAGYK